MSFRWTYVGWSEAEREDERGGAVKARFLQPALRRFRAEKRKRETVTEENDWWSLFDRGGGLHLVFRRGGTGESGGVREHPEKGNREALQSKVR